MKNNGSTSSGIGFTGLLTILFIGLKLGNVIDWSWWWVLSPLWIGLALFVILIVIMVCIGYLYEALKNR